MRYDPIEQADSMALGGVYEISRVDEFQGTSRTQQPGQYPSPTDNTAPDKDIRELRLPASNSSLVSQSLISMRN